MACSKIETRVASDVLKKRPAAYAAFKNKPLLNRSPHGQLAEMDSVRVTVLFAVYRLMLKRGALRAVTNQRARAG